MGTLRQKEAAKLTVEKVRKGTKVTKGEILKEVGYADSVTLHPDKVFETEGFKEEITKLGFDSDNAKRVIGKILDSEYVEEATRIAAAREIFKVNGDYAPEKRVSVNVEADEQILRDIIARIRG